MVCVLRNPPNPPLAKGEVWKNFLLVVTPVKTGVQRIPNGLKILDSGFVRK